MEASLSTENITITEEELKALTDAIHQRHGIDFGCYEPKSLTRRVIRVLHIFKMRSAHDLWVRILKDRAFIYPFMDEISVGLTSMFRDPVLWRKLRSMLNHEYRTKPRLSLWHAGCSTGEEVYTMGIVLRESKYPGTVLAKASDISMQAMETAKKGEYYHLKMEDYVGNYKDYNAAGSLDQYYTGAGSTAKMDESLIKHVNFEYHNLITDPFTARYDIIFCRNVMIYFDNNAKRKLFDKFYDSLNPGGIFIIGFYDAVLPLVDEKKFKVLDMDAKIFQKI